MVPRRFVRLAIVDAVGRVHAHLTPPGLKDQPTRASAQRILDVGPAEDVAKECARCGGIVGIYQGVDAGDHQTELLESLKLYYFGRHFPSAKKRTRVEVLPRGADRQRTALAREGGFYGWVFKLIDTATPQGRPNREPFDAYA